MYIKSIVLDGFKSYGNRVEITGFDPEFNAITGLNGTGKSNILDSICFVLGITNLSNVRAGSLQELIYKHGQAGITKATVSITFDNRDKDQCPMGYENHEEITVTRQVVIGGKNRYLINGVNVQNKRVSDLFCSVQLNVNNPHFLIMQGRITKVLNMKPPEILSMVEEAAGTRMYETKKQAAQKTIEKKDAKLLELNDIIKEDIAPKLQRLHDERSQYQEYQKVTRELENLTRLHVAWRYVTAEKSAKEATEKVAQVRADIESKKSEIEEKRKDTKRLDRQIDEMRKKMDQESGGAVKELEVRLQEAESVEARAAAELRAARDALGTHQKRARLLQRAAADDEGALAAAVERLQLADAQFAEQRAASVASEAALDAAQRRFLAVSSGLEGEEGEEEGGGSLRAQLMAAQHQAAAAATGIARGAMERDHCAKRLRELEHEFASLGAQFEKDRRAVEGRRGELKALEAELARAAPGGREPGELQAELRALQSSVRSQRDAVERAGAQLARCDFRYSPPAPNFDASRVSGTVSKLITVKDPKYCTALETAAGGKLYNVVVDTEVTSKLLLQRGNLQTRTTIIPLNKISAHEIPRDVVAQAQRVGGGAERVQLALDLVQCEARVRPAAAWVWGGTLVCADLDTARRVCFHPRVRRRCVTLDGDVFDPAGTLSGGAPAPGGGVLLALRKRSEAESALQRDEARLRQLSDELEAAQRAAGSVAALQRKCDALRAELEVAEARMGATAPAQQHAEMERLRARIAELAAAAKQDELTKETATASVKRLQLQLADLKGHREREFKKAEEELMKAKRDAALHGSWKQREQEYETLKLEVGELEQAVANGKRQLHDAEAAAGDLQRAQEDAEGAVAKAAESVKEVQSLIKKQKAELASQSKEVQRLLSTKERLASAEADAQLQLKELELRAQELCEEAEACGERTCALEREHSWLKEERAYFGQPGGAFDWEARGAQQAAARVAQLRERKERLARGLNARAHALLGQEEEQYQDVVRKKSKVEADKAALMQVMVELDEKKRTALLAACERVNADFASIFSTLLPGATARLRPPAGASVLEGLEVRVGFNGAWKESLSELSGGQRSLVALSLVLAMLLFKPAPLYVLDEVDAALDLSHTQNIGRMLRTHFRRSQFIVVSLKDGMFNNANVLFRTRFVDGMSAVQRTVNSNLTPT